MYKSRFKIFDELCDMLYDVGAIDVDDDISIKWATEFGYDLDMLDSTLIEFAMLIEEEYGVDVEEMLTDGQIINMEELVDYIEDNM